MPVNIDPSGSRSVQTEVVVPGTPEQVWSAIATGPGISSWFVPTEVDEKVGGKTTSNFGSIGSSEATITTWEPPHLFVAEASGELGEGGPTVATEWTVEARDGGTCTVRVVHRWFTTSDAWDGQFEGHVFGWLGFFKILRLVLTHFQGQPSAAFQILGGAPEPADVAWKSFTDKLGISAHAAGDLVQTDAAAPRLSGTADDVGPDEFPSLLAVLSEPAPGIAHLFAMPMGGTVYLSVRGFFFGEQAAAAQTQADAEWQRWIGENFPLST